MSQVMRQFSPKAITSFRVCPLYGPQSLSLCSASSEVAESSQSPAKSRIRLATAQRFMERIRRNHCLRAAVGQHLQCSTLSEDIWRGNPRQADHTVQLSRSGGLPTIRHASQKLVSDLRRSGTSCYPACKLRKLRQELAESGTVC